MMGKVTTSSYGTAQGTPGVALDGEPELPTALTPTLASDQPDLLEAIWTPCVQGLGWPVWDYVARTLFRNTTPIVEAGPLWASLPRIRQTDLRSYSLTWTDDSGLTYPSPGNRVGLTIAGLYALRDRAPQAAALADAAVLLIRSVAREVRAAEPNVAAPVTTNVPVAPLIGRALTVAGGGAVGHDDLLEVLNREYAPLDIRDDPTAPGVLATPRMFLAPYFDITTAGAYIDHVSALAAPRARAAGASPLMVTQMLDYLSLLLRADPRWNAEKALTADANLRPASTIAVAVADDAGFRDGLSALAQLLEALHIPEVADPGPHPPTKSLGKLQAWVDINIDDAAARLAATDAIKDLRAVVDLRVDAQHPGTRPKEQARRARRRLGLDDVIRDWADAWAQILGRVVEALEAIRVAVRFD